jgi:hypothetical protein
MINYTREILSFYKKGNEKNSWYLKKYLSDSENIGRFAPFAKNIFSLEKNNDLSFVGTVDDHNTYYINKFGLRGNIYSDSEVIAAGCSITFGVGVPEDATWSNFLSKDINKNINNLGIPGASVESLCHTIIKYCVNNKMPKTIFCLFPDFFRSLVVADKDFYRTTKTKKSTIDEEYLELTFCGPEIDYNGKSLFMKIKNKNCVEDSVSPHQLIIDSINAIEVLELFCLTNNIKLYWSTWHRETSELMRELLEIENFKLKNFTNFYLSNGTEFFEEYIDSICKENHNSEFKDNLSWNTGSDYAIIDNKKNKNYSHPGIHTHKHVSNFFYNLYKNQT